ncbi:MAG: entericidin A/B family lipoprotein [Alcanivorax sp.]
MKTVLTLTILAVSAIGLTACETMEGFGEDVESAGQTVQDAAEKSK